jgi:hypothetical protein
LKTQRASAVYGFNGAEKELAGLMEKGDYSGMVKGSPTGAAINGFLQRNDHGRRKKSTPKQLVAAVFCGSTPLPGDIK